MDGLEEDGGGGGGRDAPFVSMGFGTDADRERREKKELGGGEGGAGGPTWPPAKRPSDSTREASGPA